MPGGTGGSGGAGGSGGGQSQGGIPSVSSSKVVGGSVTNTYRKKVIRRTNPIRGSK